MNVWAAIGMVATVLWPLGALIHGNIEAMVLGFIPVTLMRIWDIWVFIQALWDLAH